MLKLKDIVASQESIAKLLELKLPVKISYQLSKLNEQIKPELTIYEEKRLQLIKENGTEDTEGKGMWTVKQELLQDFIKKLTELQDIDVDIEYDPIKIEDIEDVVIEPKYIIPWLFV